ncbi:hypothetical protein TSAR_000278 [Trichomalopsis sarcophagae]|uniref:Uncharacterized protein n=1 Tax=Trichomalopsis sarcophagae TaxID=543379 RepID=A0A232EP48_9HYME|nr:hypothetical protein TSAR_000278 [Trichomalopsis sarcophagae]
MALPILVGNSCFSNVLRGLWITTPCEYSSENAWSIDEANKKMLKARRSISDINSLVSCKRKAHQLETDEGTLRIVREVDEIQCATVSLGERQSLANADNEETESTTVSLRETHFVEICNSLMYNAQSVTLPVIYTGVKCIMFAEWRKNYSSMAKRIVIFSNMSVDVRIFEVTIYIEEILLDVVGIKNIASVDDISRIVSYVANCVLPCQKIDETNKSPNCRECVYNRLQMFPRF